jgi:aryl-alcohol dehydrogenase-like predicted oxidoreductase
MAIIGTSNMDIYPLGLGGNTFGNTTGPAASEKVLDAFFAAGGTLIDTADSYSSWVPGNKGGESETIIGDWLRRRDVRDAMLIATKVSQHPKFMGLSPSNIAKAADASLRRLQTDHIDLYYAHYDDEKTPIAESARAFDRLVRAGKVRYVGLSNYTASRIEEWMRAARESGFALPVALQPNYSLVHRKNYEETLAPVAAKWQLGVLPYFALASGFLSGKYRTAADLEGASRRRSVEPFLNEDGVRLLTVLGEVASAHDVAIATVALAWLLAKPHVVAPLASATSPGQLADLLASRDLRLSAADIAALDAASQPFATPRQAPS